METTSSQPQLQTSASSAYLRALEGIMRPLVRLLIAKGVFYPAVDAMLQRLYVKSAYRHFCPASVRATASRIYLLTGIHRKKVTEIMAEVPTEPVEIPNSPPQLVMDYLTTNPQYLDERGLARPLALTRAKGGEMSIEALVEAVTKDIRPRAILDQWFEAGIATINDEGLVRIHSMTAEVSNTLAADKSVIFERALMPLAETCSANIINMENEPAVLSVRVAGLSRTNAQDLKREFHAELASLMAAYNKRAEKLAADDLNRGTARTILYLGAYEWIGDLVPASE
jgi:hypothetical protein